MALRSIAPHFEKSGNATEPPDSVATLACPPPPRLDITCLVKFLTSSWLIRPPGPVPGTWCRSTPSSRASLRTEGAAGASGPRSAAGAVARLAAKASTFSLRSPASSTSAATLMRPRSVGLSPSPGLAFEAAVLSTGAGLGAGGADGGDGGAGVAAAGAAAAPSTAPASSTTSTACPGLTLSPCLTRMSLTRPATVDGTSRVALSVSNSSTG